MAVLLTVTLIAMLACVDGQGLSFNLAFFVVLVSLLVQGASLTTAALIAKVERPPKPVPVSRSGVEIYPGSEWEVFVYCLSAKKWCVGESVRRLSMPEGTRIATAFRGQQLLHPSGSTRLMADDILRVLAHEDNLDALSQLFSQAPEESESNRFFGDFFI